MRSVPLRAVVIVAVLFLAAGIARADYCELAKEAIKDAAKLRGLSPRKEVPCEVKDQDSTRDYILSTIKEKLPADRLKNEAYAYKAIGMIPEDFDYEKGIVEMYVSQIGGFYDPDKKLFVMAAWIPEMMQRSVAVHELTHGLQDQYFDLSKFIDMSVSNSDEQLAHSALVEGDATIVMLDYSRQQMGQGRLASEPNVENVIMQSLLGASIGGTPGNVPESLKMMMLFPYTSGLRLAHVLLHKEGYSGLNEAFKKGGPRSTEEVLHPEKFGVQREDFLRVSAESLRPAGFSANLKPAYEDTIGEFGISALLGMFVKNKRESTSAAAGWGGDRIAIFREGGRECLVWKTHWDSEADADEFERVFQSTIKARSLYKDGSKSGMKAPERNLKRTPDNVLFESCGS